MYVLLICIILAAIAFAIYASVKLYQEKYTSSTQQIPSMRIRHYSTYEQRIELSRTYTLDMGAICVLLI